MPYTLGVTPDPEPHPFPLAHRDFRWYWLGNVVSLTGSEMTRSCAIPWQIYLLTNKSAYALGSLGLAKALPIIFMAPFGGMIADAVDRRRLLMITQGCLLVISSVLAWAAWTGQTTEWLLYATSPLAMLVA
jgi:hypothetical protein